MMIPLLLWGCGKGGGSGQAENSDANASVQPKSSYSDKAMIGSSTGGSMSIETDDGFFVMIDIPGKAMDYSREVTLSVELENGFDEITIRIEPAVALQAGVKLMVGFPDEGDVEGKLICRKASGSPLKQGMETGMVTATVYRFGEFSLNRTNPDDMLEAAYDLLADTPDDSWQNAYETFDSLVWLSDYLGKQGHSQDAGECFSGIVSKSKTSAERFLASSDASAMGTQDFNSLGKFKQLMVLCENPDQIVDQINVLMSQVGESE